MGWITYDRSGSAGNIAGTGNKLKDMGIGALAGLGAGMNQQQNMYLPTFNYAGNGLARIGGSIVPNPNYRDMSGIGQQLAGAFAKAKRSEGFSPDINIRYPNFNYDAGDRGATGQAINDLARMNLNRKLGINAPDSTWSGYNNTNSSPVYNGINDYVYGTNNGNALMSALNRSTLYDY